MAINAIKSALTRATGDNFPASGVQTCLAQILDAIDMIVLPRDLILENGAGESLSLTVKSRRLLRLNETVKLTADLSPVIADTFADFAAKAHELKTHHSEPARSDILSEMGISVDTLQEALVASTHLPPHDHSRVLPALRLLAETQDLSWALFDHGVLTASHRNSQALQSAHDTALPHILKTEQPGHGRAASWILGPVAHTSVAIALEGQHCFIAALPPALIRTWIETCARGQA
ncbi:MAG: hypothetical protein AAF280_04030 [Pseudomonadota bacterium]